MKVVNSDRNFFYDILNIAFNAFQINPIIAELGVLNGNNALQMKGKLKPKALVLIDAWDSKAFDDYKNNNIHRPWVEDLDTYHEYFGGPVSSQSTLDKLFGLCTAKFKNDTTVTILKANTTEAFNILQSSPTLPNKFNLIYVDASHQFESVFDDLMLYQTLLATNGCFQLNDCCHSAAGVKQNLGVLEAVVKFTKMSDFIPVAITNTDWTDIILVRKNSPIIAEIDNAISSSFINYVEVPRQLLGQLQVKTGTTTNISFI
jgi:hypothetical protein